MILDEEGRFNYALDVLLQDEGGYTDDVDDPGGATNFGITQRDLDKWTLDLHMPDRVKELLKSDAARYYKYLWWDKYHYNNFTSLEIATKIFNLSVNIGPQEAASLLQEALQWSGYGIKVDGVIGPKTFAATNEMCLHGREEDLHVELNEEVSHYYEHITEENPKLLKFLKGWLRRAEE